MLDAVDVLFCFPKNSEFDHTQWKLNFLNTSLELESWYVAWWLPSIQPRAPEHVSIERERQEVKGKQHNCISNKCVVETTSQTCKSGQTEHQHV